MIPKGIPRRWTIYLFDRQGDRVDLNNVAGVLVMLYYSKGNYLRRFSYVSKTGWGNVTFGNLTNGEIFVDMTASEMQKAETGQLYAEVKWEYSNGDVEGLTGKPAGEVVESLTTHVSAT